MNANDNQVGGTHYKSGFQHWDYVEAMALPYLLAQITRYAARWRKKNGMEDLQKAIHYAQKQVEKHQQNYERYKKYTASFVKENKLGVHEEAVFALIADYHAGNVIALDNMVDILQEMLQELKAPQDPAFKDESDEWKRP